jgi:hypothetical protein
MSMAVKEFKKTKAWGNVPEAITKKPLPGYSLQRLQLIIWLIVP